METFKYTMFDKERESVISREIADRVADLFEAAKIDSPFSQETGTYENNTYVPGAKSWSLNDKICDAVVPLPNYWDLDVSYVLNERRSNEHWAAIVATTQVIEHEGIRNYLLPMAQRRERGFQEPKVRDESGLAKLASQARSTNGNTAYVPAGKTKARMLCKEAIAFSYIQDSYADLSQIAIPVVGFDENERETCNKNLYLFARALGTHNGFAGSGCTWSASLHESGTFVILSCRASIAD